MTSVDQQTQRRAGRIGLTATDEERCCPGYLLYCPATDPWAAHLIDMHGELVHEWKLPYRPAFWAYLLPNGNLFCMGKIEDDVVAVSPGWSRIEKGGALVEINWDGEVVWEHRDPYQHHDGRRTTSGGAIYLAVERIPDDVASKVVGGIPGSDEEGMWADVIVEVDSTGQRVWEWHSWEHLDYATDVLPPNVARHEWSHGNTVVPLDEDRVMVSFRHISTVGIIDKKSGEFTWKLGHDVFSGQHDPSMLPNGNVLVMDNGLFRKRGHGTFSRVIEVNPETNEVAWTYQDKPAANFYTPFIGGARRLPNGNTLITEGWFGRMFQVTLEQEVVWEFISPHFAVIDDWGGLYNVVFRSSHYQASEIPALIT